MENTIAVIADEWADVWFIGYFRCTEIHIVFWRLPRYIFTSLNEKNKNHSKQLKTQANSTHTSVLYDRILNLWVEKIVIWYNKLLFWMMRLMGSINFTMRKDFKRPAVLLRIIFNGYENLPRFVYILDCLLIESWYKNSELQFNAAGHFHWKENFD